MTVQKYLDIPWSMEDTVENLKELKEILQEELRRKNYEGQGERDCKEIALDFDRAIQSLQEVEQYRALGTVEELKEAMEKQVAKKPIEDNTSYSGYKCPTCNSNIYQLRSHNICKTPHCIFCGQALKWGEEDD